MHFACDAQAFFLRRVVSLGRRVLATIGTAYVDNRQLEFKDNTENSTGASHQNQDAHDDRWRGDSIANGDGE